MKKFLLSILCFAGLAISANADVVAFVAEGATYDGTGTVTTITNNDSGNILNTTYASDACDFLFTQVNQNLSQMGEDHARWYKGDVLTITPANGATITSVVFKVTSTKYAIGATASTGSVAASTDDLTVTWTGSASEAFTLAASEGQIRFHYAEVTYTAPVASSIATPTFSVEAGTYGVKQSIELACASDGADIYYTLDGTTPDKNATLYESAIELNTKTTVRAIAYVGEEASNVASATYDFHLEGSLSFVTGSIVFGTTQAKVEWASEDWANNTVNYLVTLDGTTPTVDNRWNTGKSKTRQLPMYSWKKDSVVTVSVRAEQDGIYSDVFTQTVFARYDAALDSYRAITTMEAGSYLIMADNTLAHAIMGDKQYDYLPKIDVTANNGTVSAFDMLEWTFEATNGGYYIKDYKGRYIYMKGTYNNFNVSTDLPTEGAVWTVTINNDGTAKIMNVEKQKFIQYSPQHNSYGSYAEASDARVMPQLAKNATPQVIMTPDLDGTTLTSLSEITFTCTDGLALGTGKSSMRNSNYDTFDFTTQVVDENTIKFVFATPLTVSDSYTFNFVKNSLIAGPGVFDMAAPIANKSYKFNILNPYEVVVTPDGKERPEKLDVFTFTNGLGLTLNPNYAGEAPYLSYKDAEGNDAKVTLVAATVDANTITLTPETKIETEGTYTLVVGEGYFLVEGTQTSPAFNNEYNLVFPIVLLSSTPAAGETIGSLSEIIVEFNKNVYLDEDETFNLVAPDGTKTKLSFEMIDATTVEVAGYWNPVTYPVAKKVRFYAAEPFTAEGDYTFVLSQYGWEVMDPVNTLYLPKTEIAFTIGKVEEPKLEGTLSFVNSPIVFGTTQAKLEWASEDWANNTVNYYVTLDGTTPTYDNKWNTGKSKTRQLPMYSWKKDSVVVVSVRAEQDSLWSDVFTQTVFARYDAALDSYRAITTMEAGNFLMITPTTVAHAYLGETTTGYLPKVDVANEGVVSAFGMLEWTFEATEGGYYIKDNQGRYVTTGADNGFAVSATLPAEGAVWTVTMNENGTAKIANAANQMYIQYDSELDAYGCFADGGETRVMPQLAENATPQVIMTPDLDGTTLASLSEITFTCTDGLALGTGKSTMRNSNYDTFDFTTQVVDENTIKFVFATPLTVSDSYTFNFVKNSLIAGPGVFDMAAPIANKSYKFNILNPYEVVVTPDGKERPEKLDVFTFTNGLGLTLNPNYAGEAPYLSYKDAEGNDAKVTLVAATVDANTITLTPETKIETEGTYTLVVGEGYFLVEGTQTSPAFNNEYNLVFPIVLLSSTPAAGETIGSLSEIIVEFNKNVYLDEDETFNLVAPDGTKTKLSFEMIDATTVEVAGYWNPVTYPVAKKVRFYAAEPFTAEGDYTFVLSQYGWEVMDPVNTLYLPKTEIAFTIGEVVADYIFNASDHEVGKYPEGLTDGITTFVQGTGTDKNWEVKANNATFNIGEGLKITNQVKPNSNKNYITIEVPGDGTLVFGVRSGSNDDNTRTMVVAQGNDTVYNAVICEENDKVDGVYNTHNVEVTAGTATVTMPTGTLLFYYIEFIPGTVAKELAIVNTTPAEGEEVASFTEMIVEFNKPAYNFGEKVATLYDANGTRIATLSTEMLDPVGQYQPVFGAAKPLAYKARLYTTTEVTTDGAYYVSMPADMFADETSTEFTTKTTVNFTVKAAAPGITATWSIEEGATIESFTSVTITFAGEGIEAAKAKSTYSNFIFYEKDAEGNYNHTTNDCTAGYMDTEATGTTVTFSLDPGCYGEPFNRKGDYRIVIPVGGIKFNNDNANLNTEEYVLNFTIANDYVTPNEIDAAFTAEPTNNSTIEELKEVVLTFTEYSEITVVEADLESGRNIPTVSMTDPEFGMTMPVGYMMTRAGAAANQLVIYVDPAYTGGLESFPTAGEYTINVPAGVVKFGNDINKAFTLNYTVTGVEQTLSIVSSDPANNSTVNKLESVVVDWNIAITMDEATTAYVENVHGIQVSTIHPVWTGLAGNQVRLVLNTPITEDGIYNLVIPAGEVKDFDTETIANEEIVLTFTVKAPAAGAPTIVSTDPADGATVDAIESITVVFNKPVFYDNYFESASLQDKGGKVIANVKSAEYKDGDEENGGTTITFNLDSKVAEANTFYFVIPAKTIVDALDWITMMEKDASIAITIGGASADDITVVGSTPSANSTVKVLEEILVEFNTGAAVLYMPDVVDESGKVLSTTTSSYTDAEGNMLPDNIARFILNTPIDPETPTNVYLVIEAGSVYDYPNYAVSNSEEIRIMITVSGQGGINGVEMDPVYGYVVYDLNGYRVMQTKKAADLERLNNGIYIINGVKVLINK